MEEDGGEGDLRFTLRSIRSRELTADNADDVDQEKILPAKNAKGRENKNSYFTSFRVLRGLKLLRRFFVLHNPPRLRRTLIAIENPEIRLLQPVRVEPRQVTTR